MSAVNQSNGVLCEAPEALQFSAIAASQIA